jgi:hypothetical protein
VNLWNGPRLSSAATGFNHFSGILHPAD